MSKITKRTILLLLGITPFAFIYLTIANSKDCSQIVIDTYEIHSGIDIPKVTPVNCYYDAKTNVRLSIYEIRGNLSLNKFTNVDTPDGLNLLFGKFLLNESEVPVCGKLFMAHGEKWGRSWTYLFDTNTSRLYAELKY